MINPIPMPQSLELRDASGSTLGVFISEMAFRELVAERDRLRKQVMDQQQQLAALQAERDAYLKGLYALLPREEISITAEELREMEHSGIPMHQVVEEIERIFASESQGGDHE